MAKQPLDQIIDSAFFTKSHHAGLAQVADLFASSSAATPNSRNTVPNPYTTANSLTSRRSCEASYRTLFPSHRWPKHPKNECAAVFVNLAPGSLVDF